MYVGFVNKIRCTNSIRATGREERWLEEGERAFERASQTSRKVGRPRPLGKNRFGRVSLTQLAEKLISASPRSKRGVRSSKNTLYQRFSAWSRGGGERAIDVTEEIMRTQNRERL